MKNILSALLLLFAGSILYATLYASKFQSQAQPPQQVQTTPPVTRNLTIYDKRSPLKINSVSIKQKVIGKDKSFTEGADWAKDLTVELSNTTGRTVTFVQVSVIVGPQNDVPFVFSMQKGRNPLHDKDLVLSPEAELRMLPGDYLTLRVDPGLTDPVKAALAMTKHANSPNVKVRVEIIGFSDGNVWMGTKEFKPNPDQQSKLHWMVIKPLARIAHFRPLLTAH